MTISNILRTIKEIKNRMENLYNYVLWYNSYNATWYGIPTDKYVEFKAGNNVNMNGIKTSTCIDSLINDITSSYSE